MNYLDEQGLSTYDTLIKSYVKGVMSERTGGSYTPTLQSAPTSSTTTYTKDGKSVEFKVGDEARVADSDHATEDTNGYVYYKLYDIVENQGIKTAYWDLSGSGSKSNTGIIEVNLAAYVNEALSSDALLNGVEVTLTNTTDGQVVAIKTWAGVKLTFDNLTPAKDYSISVNNKTGFSTPSAQTVTALGISETVIMTFSYYSKRYTVVVSDNQNGVDTGSVKVTYGGTQYSNNDNISVIPSITITTGDLTVTDITGYKKTVSISGTTITVLYQTELVTITVGTDEPGVTAQGQIVTVNGTNYTVDSTGVVLAKIPFDVVYSISVDSWGGLALYISPESQNNITANIPTRNITMTYLKVRFKSYDLIITDDQSGNYADNAEVTVKYTEDGIETVLGNYGDGDTFTVPIDSTVNLSIDDEDVEAQITLSGSTYTVNCRLLCIDMGNGVKWAVGNLSINSQGDYVIGEPNEEGAYFFYGDIHGFTRELKPSNVQSAYETGTYGVGYTIGDSQGFTPGDPTYDAARYNLGGHWRVPTSQDFSWLKQHTTRTRLGTLTTITSNINGNTITVACNDYGAGEDPTNYYYGWTNTNHNYRSDWGYRPADYMEFDVRSNADYSSGGLAAPWTALGIRPIKGTMTSMYKLDQTVTTPSSMCKFVASKDKSPMDDAVAWIRNNTKFYGAQHSLVNGKLQVKEISKTNKGLYTDGTSVGQDVDVFMKLPEFWYYNSSGSSNTAYINFYTSDPGNSNCSHWEGNTFIGVYKAYASDNKLYSRRGVSPSYSITQTNSKTAARNRGTGFTIVTYEVHQVMCLLGLAWLGTTDAQAVVGRGSSKQPKTTGICDALGMTDTVAGVNGGAADGSTTGDVSTNFWGLENWWGDIGEWIDNLQSFSSGYVYVLDAAGSLVRRVDGLTTTYGCITKLHLSNKYADVLPVATTQDAVYSSGWTDRGGCASSSGQIAWRSHYGNNLEGGLAFIDVGFSPAAERTIIGNRLVYTGDYEIIS